MTNNLDNKIKNEIEYRRLLRFLRKQEEAENSEKVDNKQTDSNQPK